MKFRTALNAFAALVFTTSVHASPLVISPIADGSLYTCTGCTTVSDGAYVTASGYIQGTVKFSTSLIPTGFTEALLSLNPYALPLWGPTVDIYGYGTTIGALDVTDANAGAFLGTLTLPTGLSYGQDVYFDVSAFVASIDTPFVAFNLRSEGTNQFSSLEYNYGHPSQLLITSVPVPSAIVFLSTGLFAVLRTRRRTHVGSFAKFAV